MRCRSWLSGELAALALCVGCTGEPPSTPMEPTPESMAAIDDVLRTAVSQGDVPGVVAAAASRNGVLYRAAFGKRDEAAGIEMTSDTIFRIASMTKAVTSVAVMQLVEEGKVDLDEPAATYLPALEGREVLEDLDEAGAPILRPARSPVTVRQLLSHTSGFAYEVWNDSILELVSKGLLTSAGVDGGAFLEAPLVFDPGQRWEYGISVDWLGRLVELVSGQTLDEYFRQHIFEPLGMTDSHFNLPLEKEARLVTVHQRQDDGGLVEAPRETLAPVTFFSGGGGLVSTADDYLRFLRSVLAGGSLDGVEILQPATVQAMAENQIGELEAGAMRTVMPAFSNDFDFFPGSVDRFGLGFLLNSTAVEGGRAAGSLAWAGLYNTYFWIDRERGVCAVLLTQTLPFYDAKTIALLDEFERALYAALDNTATDGS